MEQPNKVECLKNISKLESNTYSVFVYVLSEEIESKEDIYGFLWPLGEFSKKSKANKYAKKVIEKTQCPWVTVAKTNMPFALTLKPTEVSEVKLDEKGKLIQIEDELYKKEIETFKKQEQLKKEIEEEIKEEQNETSIEYFKREAYMAIKHKFALEKAKKEFEFHSSNYEIKIKNLRNNYRQFPEHEQQFLEFYKNKLSSRDELPLYHEIENGYQVIRNDIV